jgi:hypothetical protein
VKKWSSVGFTYDRLGHGKSAATKAKWSKGYLEAEADFLKNHHDTNLKTLFNWFQRRGGGIALYAAKYQTARQS